MEKKNTILLTVIAVATLLVAVVGATFAYFTATVSDTDNTNVSVTTNTTDSFVITAGSAIGIIASQSNFAEGAGSLTGTSSGSVVLTANTAAAATYCYSAAFSVASNDFVYSTLNVTSDAELTLTVTKNGTAITAANNADITTGTTGISLGSHTITATAGATTTDTWVATVTLVNLAVPQTENENRTFTGSITFNKVAC